MDQTLDVETDLTKLLVFAGLKIKSLREQFTWQDLLDSCHILCTSSFTSLLTDDQEELEPHEERLLRE